MQVMLLIFISFSLCDGVDGKDLTTLPSEYVYLVYIVNESYTQVYDIKITRIWVGLTTLSGEGSFCKIKFYVTWVSRAHQG